MDITITTPALLFPAISLLLLAFTNRFIALASLVRNLKEQYVRTHSHLLMGQIRNLRERLILIRNMQTLGISSMFMCVLCMFVLFAGELTAGKYLFGISLLLLMASLALSIREIHISVNALKIELSDMENQENQKENNG
ncbi:MAG: hypothetical protein JWQ14_2459 [Adhaeribacter sp.]|jgi:hypothetical protein|nr:hypothetical protein [Adhaeribacter sp.]